MSRIVYLLGWPGVGKRTVALALAERTGAVVVDSQSVNIPVFALLDWDGRAPLPPEVWGYTRRIRDVVLEALERLAPADVSYVLTNVLKEDDGWLYTRVEEIARARGATFVSVLLTCELDEHCRRVTSSDRAARLKLTDAQQTRAMVEGGTHFVPVGANSLTIDSTTLSPAAVAEQIVRHAEAMEGRFDQS